MTTFNISLNGQDAFSAFGDTWDWSNEFLDGFQPYTGPNPNVSHVLNVSLTGDWYLPIWRVAGEAQVTTTITDSAVAGDRRIEFMRLGPGDATITLRSTEVGYIEGYDGPGAGDTRLTTGAEYVRGVRLIEGDNVVTVGTGGIESIRFGDGNDRLIVNNTRVDYAAMGGGTNRVTVSGDDRIQTLQASDATNIVTLKGDARVYLMKLDSSTNTVTTADGNVESFFSYESDNTLDIGAGGIQQIVFGGDGTRHTVTADGFIGSLQAYDDASVTLITRGDGAGAIRLGDGDDTVRTGAGSVGQIRTRDGVDTVTLGAGGAEVVDLGSGNDAFASRLGYVESISLGDGNDRAELGSGGTDQVFGGSGNDVIASAEGFVGRASLGDGNDRVTLGAGGADLVDAGAGNDTVVAGTGYVFAINTREGDDVVRLGTGGTGFVRVGQGDDTLVLNRAPSAFGVQVQGESGTDTLNLSAFNAATTLTLEASEAGRWQEVAVGQGYVGITHFENVTGGAFADAVTGSDEANVLAGAGGADRLRGLLGDDTLNGGAGGDILVGGQGDDRLIGGTGSDVFRFQNGDGRDRIAGGFALGSDHIEFVEAASFSQLSFGAVDAGARVSFGGTVVIVEGVTVAQLNDVDNFLF